MKIPFWKMHGAANDFILVDDRMASFPCADTAWMAAVSARRTGVGCEGIILIQPSDKADFRMRFFNPDGSEVEMCGNGARCVARLAHELGVAPRVMTIDTVAGILRAEALAGDRVRLGMTPPRDWRLNRSLAGEHGVVRYSFVNTGVPHAVVRTENIEGCDVFTLGLAIRRHADFSPAGTNVNFFRETGPQTIRVRTYERGVEAETLACGTGIVAVALVAARLGLVRPPVCVSARGGDLAVDFRLTDSGAADVTLMGPAVHVFRGDLPYAEGSAVGS